MYMQGDVLEFLATGTKAAPASAGPGVSAGADERPTAAPVQAPAAAVADAEYVDIPLTNMRKIIAQRLTESKQTIPHSYATVECCLDTLTKLRKKSAGMPLPASSQEPCILWFHNSRY